MHLGIRDFASVFFHTHWVRFIPDRSLEGNLVLLALNCLCSERGCFFQGRCVLAAVWKTIL